MASVEDRINIIRSWIAELGLDAEHTLSNLYTAMCTEYFYGSVDLHNFKSSVLIRANRQKTRGAFNTVATEVFYTCVYMLKNHHQTAQDDILRILMYYNTDFGVRINGVARTKQMRMSGGGLASLMQLIAPRILQNILQIVKYGSLYGDEYNISAEGTHCDVHDLCATDYDTTCACIFAGVSVPMLPNCHNRCRHAPYVVDDQRCRTFMASSHNMAMNVMRHCYDKAGRDENICDDVTRLIQTYADTFDIFTETLYYLMNSNEKNHVTSEFIASIPMAVNWLKTTPHAFVYAVHRQYADPWRFIFNEIHLGGDNFKRLFIAGNDAQPTGFTVSPNAFTFKMQRGPCAVYNNHIIVLGTFAPKTPQVRDLFNIEPLNVECSYEYTRVFYNPSRWEAYKTRGITSLWLPNTLASQTPTPLPNDDDAIQQRISAIRASITGPLKPYTAQMAAIKQMVQRECMPPLFSNTRRYGDYNVADFQSRPFISHKNEPFAMDSILTRGGFLQLPTGAGKTLCQLAMTVDATPNKRTIIIVDTSLLVQYKKEYIRMFGENTAKKCLRVIGTGKDAQAFLDCNTDVTAIIITTRMIKSYIADFGKLQWHRVIVDEVHKLPQSPLGILDRLSRNITWLVSATIVDVASPEHTISAYNMLSYLLRPILDTNNNYMCGFLPFAIKKMSAAQRIESDFSTDTLLMLSGFNIPGYNVINAMYYDKESVERKARHLAYEHSKYLLRVFGVTEIDRCEETRELEPIVWHSYEIVPREKDMQYTDMVNRIINDGKEYSVDVSQFIMRAHAYFASSKSAERLKAIEDEYKRFLQDVRFGRSLMNKGQLQLCAIRLLRRLTRITKCSDEHKEQAEKFIATITNDPSQYGIIREDRECRICGIENMRIDDTFTLYCGHGMCKKCISHATIVNKGCPYRCADQCGDALPYVVVSLRTRMQKTNAIIKFINDAAAVEGVENIKELEEPEDVEGVVLSDDEGAEGIGGFNLSQPLIDQLKNIFTNELNVGDRVVMFAKDSKEANALSDVLNVHDTTHIKMTSADSASSRAQKLQLFQDGDARVLLTTFGIATSGLNLTAANHIIMLEVPMHLTSVKQIIGRVRRIGQTKQTYIHFITRGQTIDRDIVQSMRHHINTNESGNFVLTAIDTYMKRMSR